MHDKHAVIHLLRLEDTASKNWTNWIYVKDNHMEFNIHFSKSCTEHIYNSPEIIYVA